MARTPLTALLSSFLLIAPVACDKKADETAKAKSEDGDKTDTAPANGGNGPKPADEPKTDADGTKADETANADKGEGHPNSYRPHDDQIYDEKADAQKEVEAAIAQAKRENKRVLIMYGGNWCSWCWKLHDTMEADADIKKRLEDSYVVVLVSIHENEGFPSNYGAEAKGYPYLTVLDGDGKAVTHQETGSLEEGDHHDPKKVLDFLNKFA